MRLSTSRSDDADVIRARLRALLEDARRPGGWLPDDLPDVGVGDHDARGELDDHLHLDDHDQHHDGHDHDGDDHDDDATGLPAGMGRHRAPGRAVRWDPGRRAGRSLWVAGLTAAILLAGCTWLQRPQVEPAPARPAVSATSQASAAETVTRAQGTTVGETTATPATVVVSVVGLVARPGLVTLPSGARVAAALDAAGGLLPEADPASVNLAALVADGEQIAVGVPGALGATATTGQAAAGRAGPVGLNTADAAELDALPGIGPVLAQRIVDYRTRNGPFTSVDQLDDVPGIGPAIFAELAQLVTV